MRSDGFAGKNDAKKNHLIVWMILRDTFVPNLDESITRTKRRAFIYIAVVLCCSFCRSLSLSLILSIDVAVDQCISMQTIEREREREKYINDETELSPNQAKQSQHTLSGLLRFLFSLSLAYRNIQRWLVLCSNCRMRTLYVLNIRYDDIANISSIEVENKEEEERNE